MADATWDNSPVGDVNDGWTADEGGAQFNGQFSQSNISKHDGDNHFAHDRPDKSENTGECYNCGEIGHNKAECTNPSVEREFTGECHRCGATGHRAVDCPDKPLMVCKSCKCEGHIASECTANRMHSLFASLEIQEMSPEDAWKLLEVADQEKDIEDIKKAILTYAKSFDDTTFEELETTFREAEMNTFLIAKQQEVSDLHTIVNLQGKAGQKYAISFQFSARPRRAKFAEGWPASPEENLARLEQAGFVMDSLQMKCSNCGEIGHGSRHCTQEKNEVSRVAINCANCGEAGHRARDCTQERKSANKGCRNCGSEDHIAKECTEPRSAEGVECKNCGEMGHFSRDCPSRKPEVCHNCGEEGHRSKECEKERVIKCHNCDGEGHVSKECPEPRNMAKVQCRNCDEFGHTSRDCPKPTDWSRVECSICHAKGHSYRRCTKPSPEEAGGDGGWNGTAEGVASSGAANGDWQDSAVDLTTGTGGDWESNAAPGENSLGGW